jgi:uncharacterized protein (DUF111 family)
MKTLYYDCFCGISGDMNLGALIDLGADGEYLIEELAKLHLDSQYEIKINKELKMGITGTKVEVVLPEENGAEPHDGPDESEPQHQPRNDHSHDHDHQPHHHKLDEKQVHDHHHHHHHHRNFQEIKQIILGSGLNDQVKKSSLEMFQRIAQAEAKIHGKSPDEVHFHEVGAIDSIVDMVGAAIALDYLKPDRILASPVQVGGGFVQCAHGLFPVPAPATTEILTKIPIKTGLVPFETTTPTGAAILAANVHKFTDKLELIVEKIGYGIGRRDLEIPNVLRVYLGH